MAWELLQREGTSISLLQQEWVGPYPKATEDR